jgi:hypothetical protein
MYDYKTDDVPDEKMVASSGKNIPIFGESIWAGKVPPGIY